MSKVRFDLERLGFFCRTTLSPCIRAGSGSARCRFAAGCPATTSYRQCNQPTITSKFRVSDCRDCRCKSAGAQTSAGTVCWPRSTSSTSSSFDSLRSAAAVRASRRQVPELVRVFQPNPMGWVERSERGVRRRNEGLPGQLIAGAVFAASSAGLHHADLGDWRPHSSMQTRSPQDGGVKAQPRCQHSMR
jgi:hypothetical protein